MVALDCAAHQNKLQPVCSASCRQSYFSKRSDKSSKLCLSTSFHGRHRRCLCRRRRHCSRGLWLEDDLHDL